jgi:cbb3-type cytochrome oxidase subunit 3
MHTAEIVIIGFMGPLILICIIGIIYMLYPTKKKK